MGLTVQWVKDNNQSIPFPCIQNKTEGQYCFKERKEKKRKSGFIACETGSSELGKDWVKVIQMYCLPGHSPFLSLDDDTLMSGYYFHSAAFHPGPWQKLAVNLLSLLVP